MIHIKQTLAVLVASIVLSSCGSMMGSSSGLMKIQKGMVHDEVSQILGKPDFRRFDENGEQWEYTKTNPFTGYNTQIIVDFTDGRVSNMNSFDSNSYPAPPIAVCPPAEMEPIIVPSTPIYPDHHRPNLRAMNDRDFQQFYNDVKRKPFKDDQLKLLATGAMHNLFTSQQCVRLMSIYTFDDDKLKVVEIIAPGIVDRENYMSVMNSFSFQSSRDKAKSLFGNRPVHGAMNNDQFQRLYNNVKGETFKDDQFKALTRGAIGKNFTCSQCIRLMSIFTFDDEKMKVVETLADRIVDRENGESIVKAVSFISSQDRVKALFGIKDSW